MNKWINRAAVLGAAAVLIVGCGESISPVADKDSPMEELARLEANAMAAIATPPPAPLVTVNFGAVSSTFWPYSGVDFSGTPQDPINLIFVGHADPREIRAALLALDGDRSAMGLPPVAPFNSDWSDAIGDVQTAYGDSEGWIGSVIQLQCGDYMGPRFHLRLFRLGDWTVANAHFEILIPGTTDHQVLTWELAEQFVVGDFMRTGLLDPQMPLMPSGPINQAPFRTIPAVIYNALPVELRALIGGPLGDVAADVPIATDGSAIILNLADRLPYEDDTDVQDFTIDFNQVIPKPFCASGPMDYLYVAGPVRLRQTARMTELGTYEIEFTAHGDLSATPIDPLTGQPSGETIPAFVLERHSGQLTDQHSRGSALRFQRLGAPGDEGSGRLFMRLRAGAQGQDGFELSVLCGDEPSGSNAVAGLLESAAGLSTRDQTNVLRTTIGPK